MASVTSVPKMITIKAVLNGYRVEVGCQELVFESRKRMLKELKRYLKNPDKVEAEYMSGKDAPPLEEYMVEINPERMRFGTWQDDGSASSSATYDQEVPSTYTHTFAETESVARLRQDAINYLRNIRESETDQTESESANCREALAYLHNTESHPGSQVQ